MYIPNKNKKNTFPVLQSTIPKNILQIICTMMLIYHDLP